MNLANATVAQILIPVEDFESGVAFYRDVLGIPFLFSAPPQMAFFLCGGVRLLVGVMRADTPAPLIIPTNRGGVQLEWHTRGIDLEVEAKPAARVHVFFHDHREQQEWEGDLSKDLTPLSRFLVQLSDRG